MRFQALAALLIGCASPAMAGDLTLSGDAAAVSDYRFRGISQSGKDPALQAELKLSHASGFHVGAWGSTIDLYDDGSDAEIDAVAGWSGDLAPGVSADIGVTYYLYPGVAGATDYAEALASISFALGPIEATLGGGYFPDQKATADTGAWLYAEAAAALPGAITLTGHAGRQFLGAGFGADADYWEWSLGVSRDFGPVTATVSYIDTDLPKGFNAGAGLVASIGIGF